MTEQPGYQKTFGTFSATMLIAGSMIGSGIFIVPAEMVRLGGSGTFLLAAWVFTALLTLLGAHSYGELAGMFPKAGGQYAYLMESYGPFTAFLYGWMRFLVGAPGSIAAYAVGAATFAAGLGLFSAAQVPGGTPAVEVGMIVIFRLLNCMQLRWGARAQLLLTTLKCGAIIALIGGIALFGKAPETVLRAAGAVTDRPWYSAFGLAMIAALWAFDIACLVVFIPVLKWI